MSMRNRKRDGISYAINGLVHATEKKRKKLTVSMFEDDDEDNEWNISKERETRHNATPKSPRFRICRNDLVNRGKWAGKEKEHAPNSTCGSSSVTAFSTSVPPTRLVFGVLQNDATHQRGKITNPTKKHQACIGEPVPGSPLLAK